MICLPLKLDLATKQDFLMRSLTMIMMNTRLKDDLFTLEIGLGNETRFSDEESDNDNDEYETERDQVKLKTNNVELPEAYQIELCPDVPIEKDKNNRRNIVSTI